MGIDTIWKEYMASIKKKEEGRRKEYEEFKFGLGK